MWSAPFVFLKRKISLTGKVCRNSLSNATTMEKGVPFGNSLPKGTPFLESDFFKFLIE